MHHLPTLATRVLTKLKALTKGMRVTAQRLWRAHLDTLESSTDLGPAPAAIGSHDNEVEGNWCPANAGGIVVEDGSRDNHIVENIALASFVTDLVDFNDAPPCANTWILNLFLSRGGDGAICIF